MFLTPDGASLTSPVVCRPISLPVDLWPYAVGALEPLTVEWSWEQFGDASIDELTQVFRALLAELVDGCGGMVVGTIIPHARETLPDGWLACDGSTYLRQDYPDLYGVLDAGLIIDANSFAVPDLRARFPLATGSRDGFNPVVGSVGGDREVTLTLSQMPVHAHPIMTEGVEPGYVGGVAGLVPIDNVPLETGAAGGDQPHNNMPPYFAINYAIVARVVAAFPAAPVLSDITHFTSEWFAVGPNIIYNLPHGLSTRPSIVEVWHNTESDGSGTSYLVTVVGQNTDDDRGIVRVTDTDIIIRTGADATNGVIKAVGRQSATGYYRVLAW